jgi:hypothetical protein
MINGLDKNLLTRLSPTTRVFPAQDPRSLFNPKLLPFKSQNLGKITNEELENELNRIADNAKTSHYGQPALSERWKSRSLDCFLYAQDNQYLPAVPTQNGNDSS